MIGLSSVRPHCVAMAHEVTIHIDGKKMAESW